ncbi:MAG: LamG-like jellyroll fold domain-containing protein [Bacteroidales bacterium]|jgi:hypothetical protein
MAYSFINSYPDTADTNQYTYSVSFGDAAADRYIIVTAAARKAGASTTITGVTIGGVSATEVHQNTNTSTNTDVSGIFIAAVPTGTSGNVVVTYGATMVRSIIGVYRVTSLSSATASDTAGYISTADPTNTLDIPAGGFAVAVALTNSGGTTTWTGLTEDFDGTLETFVTYSGASKSFLDAQTGLTITADFSGATSEAVASFASWGISTGTATNSTRGAHLTGKSATNSTRGAITTGSHTLSADHFTIDFSGAETANSTRAAHMVGVDTANDERGAHVIGKDTTSANRSARVTGQAAANATRGAHLIGQSLENTERGAHVIGIDTATSDRAGHIIGLGGTASNRGAHVVGVDTTADTRGGHLVGVEGSNSDRAGHLAGIDTTTATRGAHLIGKSTDNDERGANTYGQVLTNSNRAGHITGTEADNDERTGHLEGIAGSSSTRGGHISGTTSEGSERGAKITGFLPDPWSNGYTYQGAITIDYTKVSGGDKENFTFAFEITDPDLKSASNGGKVQSESGYDITFASDYAGLNALGFDIELYEPSTGRVVGHVLLPTLSSTVDTIFYIFYGNSEVTTQQWAYGDAYTTGYTAAYYMSEVTSADADHYRDFSGNNYHLTGAAAPWGPPGTGDDLIGKSTTYVSNTNKLERNDDTGIVGAGNLVVSALVYLIDNPADERRIVTIREAGTFNTYIFGSKITSKNTHFQMGLAGDVIGDEVFPAATWTYVVGIHEGAQLRLHVITSSIDKTYTAATPVTTTYSGSNSVWIGGDVTTQGWNGSIDETRISYGLERDYDWIRTEANMYLAQSTFFTYVLGNEADVWASQKAGHLAGSETDASERPAIASGVETDNDERGANLTGKAAATSERAAELTAKDAAATDRGAGLFGVYAENDQRAGKLSGQATAASNRSATLRGLLQSNDERGAKLTGNVSSIRGARLRGSKWHKKAKPSWYNEDPKTYASKTHPDWYDEDPKTYHTKSSPNWYKKY